MFNLDIERELIKNINNIFGVKIYLNVLDNILSFQNLIQNFFVLHNNSDDSIKKLMFKIENYYSSLNNHIEKLSNYTARAIKGIENSKNIIINQKNRIKNIYIKLLNIIYMNEYFSNEFAKYLKNTILEIIKSKNNYLLSLKQKIELNISENKNIHNEIDKIKNKINSLNYEVSKNNLFFREIISKNIFVRFFYFLFSPNIRESYKEYKSYKIKKLSLNECIISLDKKYLLYKSKILNLENQINNINNKIKIVFSVLDNFQHNSKIKEHFKKWNYQIIRSERIIQNKLLNKTCSMCNAFKSEIEFPLKINKCKDCIKKINQSKKIEREDKQKNIISKIKPEKGISKLLNMNYQECVNYLLDKYGSVPFDYFCNSNCKSKNPKNSRTFEGLYIHHIDEDKAIMLSTKQFALRNPFEYQKSTRLVYCNLIEHLILHIKIWDSPPNSKKNAFEAVGIGGIYNFIVPELNDIYSGINYNQLWRIAIVKAVKPLREDYLKCIAYLVKKSFNKPLLTSAGHGFGNWDISRNKDLFLEMKNLGVIK